MMARINFQLKISLSCRYSYVPNNPTAYHIQGFYLPFTVKPIWSVKISEIVVHLKSLIEKLTASKNMLQEYPHAQRFISRLKPSLYIQGVENTCFRFKRKPYLLYRLERRCWQQNQNNLKACTSIRLLDTYLTRLNRYFSFKQSYCLHIKCYDIWFQLFCWSWCKKDTAMDLRLRCSNKFTLLFLFSSSYGHLALAQLKQNIAFCYMLVKKKYFDIRSTCVMDNQHYKK